MQRRVLIYRDLLLPYSETFIPAQVESFATCTGFYVGTSRTSGITSLIPSEKSVTLSEVVTPAVAWKMAFKLGGVAHPTWLRLLRDLSPSLIHAHFGLDGVLALPLAQKLKLPLVVTFHGNDITGMERPPEQYQQVKWLDLLQNRGQFFRDLYLRRRNQLFQEARCVIAVSEFIRTQLIEKGCPPHKVVVHYIGVDVDKFTADPTVEREPVVLFVGRLVEKKGCEYLIQAMAQVQAQMPETKLVIIGDGPLRSQLEQQAASCLKHYHFLGAQPPDVVQSWMNRASVLSVPSIIAESGDAEGFGMVFAEAQAMNLPAVSFASGGVPEAIAHEQTGFLAPEKDWEALAQFLLKLLGNSSLREQFAVAGRKRIEQEFNLKQNTAILEDLYNRITEQTVP